MTMKALQAVNTGLYMTITYTVSIY